MRSVSLLCVASVAAVAAAGKRPSFIVFNIDDGGIDQVNIPSAVSAGLVGYTGEGGKISTPNIARLGAEGMVFQNWYSSFHVCSPSRASLMTGRLSVRSGVGIPNCQYAPNAPGYAGCNDVFTADAIGGLPLNESVVAEELLKAGYATAMVGKWHLGQRPEYMPTSRGYQIYVGLPASQDMGLSLFQTGDWRPHPPFQPAPLALYNGTEIFQQPADLGTLNSLYANVSVDFIQRSGDEPFFLSVQFNHVHAPNSAGPAFCGKSQQGPLGDAMEELDHAVGLIMDAARASGQDILTILLSDNGAPLNNDANGNKPLRGGKTMVWEGGFREPGLVHGSLGDAGNVTAGTVSHALVTSMDVYPTLLRLAGVPLPTDRVIDGLDLTPLITAERDSPWLQARTGAPDAGVSVFARDLATGGHTCVFVYFAAVASNASDPDALAAVRCGKYKAYWFTNGTPPPGGRKGGVQDPPLLFDVVADVGEDNPIEPNTTEYDQAMATLRAARAKHLATITPVPDQNARGSDIAYAPCADHNSTHKYPRWPNCTLTPETWQPSETCGNAVCVKRFGLEKACKGPPSPARYA